MLGWRIIKHLGRGSRLVQVLTRNYCEGCWYFESIELVRKFLLCGCLRFIEPGSATQIIVGIIFCVLCVPPL